MAKKGYIIQPSKKATSAPLFLVVRTKSNTTCKVNTGVVVPVTEWQKYKKAKNIVKFFDMHRDIRNRLEQEVEPIITAQIEKGVVSGAEISHAIAATHNKEVVAKMDEALASDRSILFDYVSWYIDEASKKNGIVTKERGYKPLSPSFIKTFKNMRASLGRYLGDDGKKHFTFNMITKRWAAGFRLWLLDNDAPSTAKTYLSCLNIICRYALTDLDEDGRPANPNGGSITLFGMKGIDEEMRRNVSEILTDGSNNTCNEFQALYDMEIEDKDDALIRDMFLWQCFCGQRMSDVVQTSPSDFDFSLGYPVYRHKAQKTDIEAEVAIIDPMAQEILKRHDYSFPKVGERFYNLHLRKVLHNLAQTLTHAKVETDASGRKNAVIEKPLMREVSTILTAQEKAKERKYLSIKAGTFKGDITPDDKKMVAEMDEYAKEHGTFGNTEHVYLVDPNHDGKVLKYRWEILTSHSGRRTFATLEFQKGLHAEEIAIETGHKDTRTLVEKYKRTPSLWNAQNVAKKKMAQLNDRKDMAVNQ